MTGENTEMPYTVDALVRIGFEWIATWNDVVVDENIITYATVADMGDRLTRNNALYAFCCGDKVCYIGKTTQGLSRRLYGYCNPGTTQATNRECNRRIREKSGSNPPVKIFAFAPQEDLLMYCGFQINLAAGLEDVLIQKFAPEWNRIANNVG